MPGAVGKTAASAGRSTPGSAPSTIFAEAMAAPVLPAVTKPSRLPFADQPQTDAYRGVALGTNRLHRLIFHRDDFAGMDNLDRQARRRWVTVEFRLNGFFRTNEQHTNAIIARGVNCPFDFRLGRPVRTHRIQRDHARHVGRQLAGFFDLQYIAALVITALRASAMRHLFLVAVGTLGKRVALESIVRPPRGCALLRMSSFWIRHGLTIPLAEALQPRR